MGHSAGGHLALLYAYMSAEGATVIDPDDETKNIEFHDVQLVISEAGPIEFTASTFANIDNDRKAEIYAMAGISSTESDLPTKLDAVSPSKHVTSSSPYTILAYGKVVNDKDEIIDSDGVVPYSQAESLKNTLYENSINYTLFELIGVGHNDFGEESNGNIKIVHPDNTNQVSQFYFFNGDDATQNKGLEDLILEKLN